MATPLLDALPGIAERVRAAPHILLFCDFDGALAPVYDHPAAATLSNEVRAPLAGLAASGRTNVIVVSGRSAEDLRSRADVPGLIVAGNHGLEIAGPGWDHVDPAVAEHAPYVRRLGDALVKALQSIPGVFVEEKGLSVGVHYRHVDAGQHEAVRTAVHNVLGAADHPFVLTNGRMVYDIRPRVYWHKGEAVRWVAAKVGQPNALVIFVGGDPTDEDAFGALPDGITVGVAPTCETAAKYCLDGPDGVRRFLDWLRDQLR
jgi:trehalose-phosphatase